MSETAEMATISGHTATTPLDGATASALRADLLKYLIRLSGDPTLAEDLAHEAMVHTLQGLPEFRGAATLRTWVRRIAQNVWRDHLRRNADSPVERAARGDRFSVDALLDSIGPTTLGLPLDDAHDRRTTHDCLLAASRRLPLAQREVILLHDLGAIPLERVAVRLGCSVGATKVRLHRAHRRLAELCRAECASETGADGTTLCSPAPASGLRAGSPPIPIRSCA